MPSVVNRAHGVTIVVPVACATHADVGLYQTADGNGELRWSEVALAGTADTYAAGILAAVGPITEEADYSRTGAPTQIGGLTITSRNVDQMHLRFQELQVELVGCEIRVDEFIGTDADADATSKTRRFTGYIESVKADVAFLTIECVSGQKKRNAQILTTVNLSDYPDAGDSVGTVIPATFGTHAWAKAVRTRNMLTVYTGEDIVLDGETGTVTPAGITIFPVSAIPGGNTPDNFCIDLATATTGTVGEKYLIGCYVKVVMGGSASAACVGQVRKITDCIWSVVPGGAVSIRVMVDTNFPGALAVSGTKAAWVQIIDDSIEYAIDTMTLASLDTSAGAPTTDGSYDIAAYDADGYSTFPKFITSPASDRTSLTVLGSKATGVGEYTWYESAILGAVAAIGNATLYGWCTGGIDYGKVSDDGFYVKVGAGWSGTVVTTFTPGTDASLISSGTESFPISTEINRAHAFVIPIDLSAISGDLEFDSVAIGIKLTGTSGGRPNFVSLEVCHKFWNGTLVSDCTQTGQPNTTEAYLDDMPDVLLSRSLGDEKLLVTCILDNADRPTYTVREGYASYVLSDITSVEQLRAIAYLTVVVFYNTASGAAASSVGLSADTYLHQPYLLFKRKKTLAKTVYVPVHGRTFRADWGTRKAPGSEMTNGVDFLESVLRRQNWNSDALTNNVRPGYQYHESAAIDTTAFDAAVMAAPKAIPAARQIVSEADGWTDALTRSLCREFFFASYQNASGQESVDYLLSGASGSGTITLADIVDGELGEIVLPNPANIFVEPTIRYGYDPGSGDYAGTLMVRDSIQATWSPDKTPGITGTGNLVGGQADGEVIWNLCRTLWQRTKRVEQMPTELSTLLWIQTYAGAVWYLYNLLTWCTKYRTSFSVPYATGCGWYPSKRIVLNLPHYTDDNAINCLIESITKDKAKATVSVKMILLDAVPTNFYPFVKYQNSYDTETETWQDNYSDETEYQDNARPPA